jgi:hypothetical protein
MRPAHIQELILRISAHAKDRHAGMGSTQQGRFAQASTLGTFAGPNSLLPGICSQNPMGLDSRPGGGLPSCVMVISRMSCNIQVGEREFDWIGPQCPFRIYPCAR